MMPLSDNFSCTKIAMDFVMPDGTTESYETRVIERQVAQQKFEDKVAAGETAVIATLPKIETSCTSNIMRISLGNIPPLATANLRAFCS